MATLLGGKPVRAMGGFFAMSLDTFVQMFKPPFAWKEYILQSWFVARVSVLPASWGQVLPWCQKPYQRICAVMERPLSQPLA